MPVCKPLPMSFEVKLPWKGETYELSFTLTTDHENALTLASDGPASYETVALWPVIVGSLKTWNLTDEDGAALEPTPVNLMKYLPRILRFTLPQYFFLAAVAGERQSADAQQPSLEAPTNPPE